jgi:hypothetical protein
VAYFKSEHGKFYTGPTANGPWQLRELTESRSDATSIEGDRDRPTGSLYRVKMAKRYGYKYRG